jgi:hypothetical protein
MLNLKMAIASLKRHAFIIAKRFLTEQSEPDETTHKLKAKDNKDISSKSLQSTYDPNATYTPTSTGVTGGQTVAHLSQEVCENCEFRSQCHSNPHKKDCVVRISLKAIKTARERLLAKTAQKENTSKRAGIDGTNSALKRGQGQGKLRVRGQVKCAVVSGLKVMAQNIRRFTKFMQGGYKENLKSALPQGILMPIPA